MKKLWQNLSHYGVLADMPIETSRKIILTNQLSLMAFVLLIIMNLGFTFTDFKFDVFSFFAISTLLTVPYFNKYGNYKLTTVFVSVSTPLCTLFFSAFSKVNIDFPVDINLYIFPKLLLISFFVLPLILIDSRDKLFLYSALIINIISFFAVDWVHWLFGVELDVSNITYTPYHETIFLYLVPVLVIISGFFFLNNINNKYENKILNLLAQLKDKNTLLTEQNEEIASQRDKIIEQNNTLEKANTKISRINSDLTNSIVYAERIQKAILPDTEQLKAYFTDSFILYQAKSIVSGDFYFIKASRVKGKECIVVSAADCTGHGVPGGFMSMLGMTFLNEIVREDKFTDAAEILNLLRHNIKRALNQTGKLSDQKDGMDMALCIYYPDTKQLDYAGAKNPVYIIDSNKEVAIHKADRMPIGIYIKEKPFTNHTIQLKGGETLYMFSDGIIDQMNEEGKKYMSRNFREYLLNIYKNEAKKQKEMLNSEMNKWRQKTDGTLVEQLDDMLVIGLKI